MCSETLKEEGIDNQTYEQLYQANPELAKNLMREGMKHLAKGIKRGRDKKGRFTKSETRQTGGHQIDQQKLDAIKAKAQGGTLSENDEKAAIDALLGKLF